MVLFDFAEILTDEAGVLKNRSFFCLCVVTLVTEVFLDFSPHERAAREPQSGEYEWQLIFAILQKKKNQEKCLGPG